MCTCVCMYVCMCVWCVCVCTYDRPIAFVVIGIRTSNDPFAYVFGNNSMEFVFAHAHTTSMVLSPSMYAA